VETAKLAREHNNANVIGIGGRMHSESESLAIVDAFIDIKFSNDERHMRRINQISEYETGGKMPPLPN
jgi:ribose 5-phosphate isomerase B